MDAAELKIMLSKSMKTLSGPQQRLAMVHLWKKISLQYGSAWVTTGSALVGDELSTVAQHWCQTLEPFSMERIFLALDELYKRGREFPPNAGQVYAVCAELSVPRPKEFLALPATDERVLINWDGKGGKREH